VQARDLGDVPDHARGRGLPVGSGDRHDRDPWLDRRRTGTGVGVSNRPRHPADDLVDVSVRQPVEHVGDGLPERLRPPAVSPRVGDDELVGVAGRAHAHRQPVGARLGRDLPHQASERASRETLAETTPGLARSDVRQPDPFGQPARDVDAHLGQRGDVERELGRGLREVQVGSLEHAQLEQR